jgi:hypothetical protein
MRRRARKAEKMAKTLDQNLPGGTPRGQPTWNAAAVAHAEVAPAAVVPAVPRRGESFSRPLSQALCDLVDDPSSGITRVTICGTSGGSVEQLGELATTRGLEVQSACSPSLDRGWIRLSRRTRSAEATVAGADLTHEGEGNGRRALSGVARRVSRLDAWLRRGLREVVGGGA